jgi:propionyl-CoA carboxylase alpha chain
MGEQAVALAKAVNYQSAGTVEFVCGRDKSFYFLEMNTRLQVEHPVTELITGLDLVELMIRVAAGEKLPFAQKDVKLDGWAMECRINAEDAVRGFLPSTGRLVKYQPPAEENGVRVDTGVYEGGEISMYYDSMIAKLIVHAKDRAAAIARMRDALNEFLIRGVASNIAFQAALMQNPRFVSGNFNTGLIAECYPKGFNATDLPHDDPQMLVVIATAYNRMHLARCATISGQLQGHAYVPGSDYVVLMGGERHPARIVAEANDWRVSCAGRSVLVQASDMHFRNQLVRFRVDGQPVVFQIERRGMIYRIFHQGVQSDIQVMSAKAADLLALMPAKVPPDMSRLLLSPMPGLLTELAVKPGQEIKAGEILAKIEAMKMENVLKAERDCVVEKLLASPGDSLAVDQAIVAFR